MPEQQEIVFTAGTAANTKEVEAVKAFTDCDPEAYASNVGCRLGRELSLSGGVFAYLPRNDTKVEPTAGTPAPTSAIVRRLFVGRRKSVPDHARASP